jgi:hypothetical protein
MYTARNIRDSHTQDWTSFSRAVAARTAACRCSSCWLLLSQSHMLLHCSTLVVLLCLHRRTSPALVLLLLILIQAAPDIIRITAALTLPGRASTGSTNVTITSEPSHLP